jgi:dipeptidyl aminopeptidase/acylaminoacyl peptidase
MSSEQLPRWERRFRAPTILFPAWAPDAPERFAICSNETESYQAYVWDRATGTRRRVTEDPVGVTYATPTADGDGIVWFLDATGDEFGRWVVLDAFEQLDGFDGRGEPRPLAPGVPDGWPSGLALASGVTAVGVGERDGFSVHVVDSEGKTRELFRHGDSAGVGDEGAMGFNLSGLSRDGRLVCIFHSEHGDNLHWALRVYDTSTGDVVGDLWDGPGRGLTPAAWSPLAGDQRLAVLHELGGIERPAIWNLENGERTDLGVDLPGEVTVADWWPDGSALLLSHRHEGVDRLIRYELDNGSAREIDHDSGAVSAARVRPDGEVWLRVSSSSHDARVITAEGAEIVAAEGERAPEGRAYRSWHYENPHGQRVHGFFVTPEDEGPHPLLMEIHGGPHSQWMDAFSPSVQAHVDAGFAVAMVNYRGSTGYGAAWRDAIIGSPGLTELEDVMAGLDSLIRDGVADPRRTVVGGASWGGYLTLLAIGKHPERWAAAAAGVPVADYVAAFEDEAPSLQAMDRGLFGGTPQDAPGTYRERSPITFADRVETPLLILAGENDSRCPIRQIDNYVRALEDRGRSVEMYRYDTGHSSFVTDERVRQMRRILEFLDKHVPVDVPSV